MAKGFLTVHIITGLTTGGAETMLYKLLSRIDRERFNSVVVSLMDRGTLGDRIAALGIPVYTIGMKQGMPTLATIWRFIAQIRQFKPDLFQGWMYHGNLAVQLARMSSFKSVPVLWNIRQSLYSLSYEKSGTSAAIAMLAQLSSFPQKILYNSKISAQQHEKIGYDRKKTLVIYNGFDSKVFTPSIDCYTSIRAELNLSKDTFLIGRIGRYHLMKDHENFLQSAALLLKVSPDLHFVLAGKDIDWQNQTLSQLIHQLGIAERVSLLGERQDIPRLTAALDIACSSSIYGDAFPNIIGEAMSCGVPCAVTDVGDSAWIVGSTGKVVPPGNSEALANACQELINLGAEARQALGKAARARIIEHFSLDSVAAQYESLYESVITQNIS